MNWAAVDGSGGRRGKLPGVTALTCKLSKYGITGLIFLGAGGNASPCCVVMQHMSYFLNEIARESLTVDWDSFIRCLLILFPVVTCTWEGRSRNPLIASDASHLVIHSSN